MMLVEHGVDLYQIDQAVPAFGMTMGVAAFGMTMGPFRMMDFVGFDVASAMKVQFKKNFGERFNELSKLIFVMQEDIQADETTRKGFYIYDGESKFTPNPDIKIYVNKARSISGLSIDYELMQLSDEEIVEMILFPVVNEACCVLEDKIVVKASDLDVASVTGMGFPEYRGGIIFWADTLGPKYICSKLEKWSDLWTVQALRLFSRKSFQESVSGGRRASKVSTIAGEHRMHSRKQSVRRLSITRNPLTY
ncbi:hypothetical protein Gohar_004889, partial [Gossypium harknessii]|nr:hypothetical protein [Gossypium harknessii]